MGCRGVKKVRLDLVWGRWLKNGRKSRHWNKRIFAAKIGKDPSYVTVMERDGYIPSFPVALSVGKAFGDIDEALTMACYINPENRHIVLTAVRGHKYENASHCARQVLNLLTGADISKQLSAIRVLRAHLGGDDATEEPERNPS